jgi:hypothetical protein
MATRGDSGDWDLDAAASEPLTIKQRVDTQLGVTSSEVIRAMQAEAAFVGSVNGRVGQAPFTDRRPIPGRKRLLP